MGETTTIFGRISINGDTAKSKKFITSLKDDKHYPWIRTEMFSFGSFEKPFYYREPILGFAATYKNLEESLKCFIIKFEFLLSNIEFYSAKMQMETEFYGTYEFFWKSKTENDNFKEKDELIETENWYFGHGYRNCWGLLQVDLKQEHIFPFGYSYPIKFDKEALLEFNKLIDKTSKININEKIYLANYFENLESNNSNLNPILTYYEVRKLIDYGYDTEKGYWIIKQKELTKLLD